MIKDMCKGAVCQKSIQFLVDRLGHDKNVLWFVSSKEYISLKENKARPDWVEMLRMQVRDGVRLLIIPPVAAQRALEEEDFTSWITRADDGSEAPSPGAIEIINSMSDLFPQALVVAPPDDRTVLARDRVTTGASRPNFVLWKGTAERSFPGTPMASVLFPALIAHFLEKPDILLGELLGRSLSFLRGWLSNEEGRVLRPDDWKPVAADPLKAII